MKTETELRSEIAAMDHRGYPAYKSLRGVWKFQGFYFGIDHVQGDPFASPSSVHVEMPGSAAGFPADCYTEPHRKLALEDHLTRLFAKEADAHSRRMGSGKSGAFGCSHPGEEILERTACTVDAKTGKILFRFRMGFPARGRSIDARAMEALCLTAVPDMVHSSLYWKNIDQKAVKQVLDLADDQKALREFIKDNHLAAFVADGAILPRESGVSQRPLKKALPFVSPESLKLSVELPHRGKISGMGIQKGITLIIGGGYHGKSTLLSALMRGVYNHIAGDGRELVVTDASAMKVRAEDGRSVVKDDISLFIHNLPDGSDCTRFSTENASGSTSQAACITEALEAGTQLLLIDEDTSATNFMMRDALMEQAVPAEKEPITPLIDRIGQLRDKLGVSTVLVAGSFGAYFGIADTVLRMDHYRVQDITDLAHKIYEDNAAKREPALWKNPPSFQRIPLPVRTFSDPRLKLKTLGLEGFSINHETVDLRLVEQLCDGEQNTALAHMLCYLEQHLFDGRRTLQDAVFQLEALLQEKGLSALTPGSTVPAMAFPRPQEIFAAVNRYRGLKIK